MTPLRVRTLLVPASGIFAEVIPVLGAQARKAPFRLPVSLRYVKKSSTFLSKSLSQCICEKYCETREGIGVGTTPHFPVPVGGTRAWNDSCELELREVEFPDDWTKTGNPITLPGAVDNADWRGLLDDRENVLVLSGFDVVALDDTRTLEELGFEDVRLLDLTDVVDTDALLCW
jgi:hypothetical protein